LFYLAIVVTFAETNQPQNMRSLGQTLKDSRDLMSLTLRQVEEATGISNAYLSQLENDKIKKPSANILYKLASIYNIELNNLLVAAGIIRESEGAKNKLFNNAALSAEQLTEEEERALMTYLKVLRQQNG
jgi:HTH-type transcriptional regulator, competence development regulator